MLASRTLESLEPPHNFPVEQALLGAILINNQVHAEVSEFLQAEHFADPLHSRIYTVLSELIERDSVADPRTVQVFMENDETLVRFKRRYYIAELAAAAISIIDAKDYAERIRDLWKRRRIMEIGQSYILEASSPAVDVPADDILEAMESDLLEVRDGERANTQIVSFSTVARRAVARIEAIHRKEPQPGLKTGLRALDQIVTLDATDLIVLAGRPGMGKSSLALRISRHIAERFREEAAEQRRPRTVAFFSLEMKDEHLATILLGQEANVSPHRAERDELNGLEMDRIAGAQRAIDALPLFVDHRPQVTPAMIRASCRRLRRHHDIGLIVVDHLHLMRPDKERRDGNEVAAIAWITAAMKGIAKAFDAPVILLSQLSRDVEKRPNKRPQLSDLRQSGSIEQDADVVMFVYREEYYAEMDDREPGDPYSAEHVSWGRRMDDVRGRAEVIVAKQRRGPTGAAQVGFRKELQLFHDL